MRDAQKSQQTGVKKILLLIPSMTGIGGTERMVHGLSSLLASGGYQVFQASFDAPGAQRHFDGATPFFPLGSSGNMPLPLRPLVYWLQARRLLLLKRRMGIDLTISNLWRADLVSAISGGADHKIALAHTNVVGNQTNQLMIKLRPLVAAVYRRFDHVVAVSSTLAQELRTLYQLADAQVSHIDNFMDRPQSDSVLPADGVQRFVWCGRFSSEKNVEGLLHAWARFASGHPDAQLVLLGDGPLKADMEAVAEALGLRWGRNVMDRQARIVFVGPVARPADYIVDAHALLLSSHAEGLPMVILEALSLGVPVLAADCPSGGVRTALAGGGQCDPDRACAEFTPAGVLLPVPHRQWPATLDRWSQSLQTLCENESQRHTWQRGALERASEFSSLRARERWLSLLGDLKGSA